MLKESDFISFRRLETKNETLKLAIWVVSLFLGFLLFITFVPWTQNVDGKGYVTTLRPEQQPHSINSYITGRIDKWYVIDGQHIMKGDTIVYMSEVKTDYFNPNLLKNMKTQLEMKNISIESYKTKISFLSQNIKALKAQYALNVRQYENGILQAKNKLNSDSLNYEVKKQAAQIERYRFNRTDSLYTLQIKSKKQREEAQLKLNKAENEQNYYANKVEITRNDVLNKILGSQNYLNEFQVKVSKAQSDQQSAISSLNDALKEQNELENKVQNIELRHSNHYIIAPHDAYVLRSIKKGIGEIVKEGAPIVSLIPIEHDMAVELYVRPIDLPLIIIGERNRLIFDGWPSLVFSGWPDASNGTFGGEVYAIDKNISKNGMYRVLIIPDKEEVEWPDRLRLGSGVKGIFLLNNVPIWYEMWRQINGFPPDFYDGAKSNYKLDESIDSKYHTK